MPVVSEEEVLNAIGSCRSLALIELSNPYYMPLGLAKISSFAKNLGIDVEFYRNVPIKPVDLICVTTLFTNEFYDVKRFVRKLKKSLFHKNTPIIVGGIAASLVKDDIDGISTFKGYSKRLDMYIPDYELDFKLKAPWDSFSYLFTQRGCVNKCGYCMVHRLEPNIWVNPTWKDHISPNRKGIVVSDNNLLASDNVHVVDVLEFLAATGKEVLFNNGIYARMISNEYAKLLSKVKYMRHGLRTAFDRMDEDGHFQRGMQRLIDAGTNLRANGMTYVLYNYLDTPQEAYYRAKEAWRYGSVPYLMQYRPFKTNKKGTYVGKFWTLNLARAFKQWGQLYGFNRGDRTFESFTKSEMSKIHLIDEDWNKWYYKR